MLRGLLLTCQGLPAHSSLSVETRCTLEMPNTVASVHKHQLVFSVRIAPETSDNRPSVSFQDFVTRRHKFALLPQNEHDCVFNSLRNHFLSFGFKEIASLGSSVYFNQQSEEASRVRPSSSDRRLVK